MKEYNKDAIATVLYDMYRHAQDKDCFALALINQLVLKDRLKRNEVE